MEPRKNLLITVIAMLIAIVILFALWGRFSELGKIVPKFFEFISNTIR